MIYADHNATTPVGPGANQGMLRALELWGNPSSTHEVGRHSEALLEECREKIAAKAGVQTNEIVFTSGGSESNGMALLGSFLREPKDFRLLTSQVEHSSVTGMVNLLKTQGAQIEYGKLLPSGTLDLEDFANRIGSKPNLVSVMTANNETGILFPIPDIAKLCRSAGVVLHTDAVQAFGKVPSSFWKDADMFSISAHKLYGPKGVGALAIRGGAQLVRTHFWGSQETKRRGGTQNMIGAAGFAGACEELPNESDLRRIEALRNQFEQKLLDSLDEFSILGRQVGRIPNTTSVRFHGISAEILLSALDIEGICVSAGSACASGSIEPSHVLLAMGLSGDEARQGLRFSWGRNTTKEEVATVADFVVELIGRIRRRRSG